MTRDVKEETAARQWQQFSFQIESFAWKAIDWIFPPECPGCGKTGSRWCPDCDRSIHPIEEPFCPICGEPGSDREICQDCRQYPPGFEALRSYTLFEGFIREALHSLKYNNNIGLGEALAPYLVKSFEKQSWNVDIVTAVPLSKKRLRSRGYNQAEKLAEPFAALIKTPYQPRVISRTVDTRSQINLSAEERRHNVSGAFYANSMYIAGKSVIIIDDVSTTGSTLSECAKALKASGARSIYALTLARAPLHRPVA